MPTPLLHQLAELLFHAHHQDQESYQLLQPVGDHVVGVGDLLTKAGGAFGCTPLTQV
jgi:hypothetical protein